MLLSPRFEQALVCASVVPAGQHRKGKDVPYIGHLLSVAAIVLEHSVGDEWARADVSREDLAIAALLHDAMEDAGGLRRLEDLRVRFGDAVADIVEQCSDSEGEPKPPWKQRYDATGRYTGSARESHGTTTFYDEKGRYAGSARTQHGTTQFYDDRGRFTGSARESPTGTTVYDSRGAYDGSARTTQGRTSSYEPSSENLSCTLPAPMICMP